MELVQSLKGFFILAVACFAIAISSAYYVMVKNHADIQRARDPESSISRGRIDAEKDYMNGWISFIPMYAKGKGCVHPGISESDFDSKYSEYDPVFYYHGCSRRGLLRRDPLEYHKINEWYVLAYNQKLSQLVDSNTPRPGEYR